MSVPFEQTLDRARDRGTALPGSTADTADIERSWRNPLYPLPTALLPIARPTDHADIIVNNEKLQHPTWEVRLAPFLYRVLGRR